MRDYYGTLNIVSTATQAEIKKAYFKLVRTYPPERHPEEFMRIREAYELLIDETTRREYDQVASMPEIVQKYFLEGRKKLAEGNAGTAIHLLEQVIKTYPDITMVQCLLGDAYLENENSVKAIRIYEQLVARDRNNAGFMRRLAHAYDMRGWHRKAIEHYRRALQLDEDNISLWLGLIECYLGGDDYELAKETVWQALEVSERSGWDNLELYYHIIQVDIFSGDRESLKTHLAEMQNKALDKEEDKANVAWFLAILAKKLLICDLYEESAATIDAAFTLIPDDEELLAIKAEINEEAEVHKELGRLKDDKAVDSNLSEMLEFEIAMRDNPFFREYDVTQFCYEMDIIVELESYRKSILHLKKEYPTLFAIKREFFNDVLDRKKEENLHNKYRKMFKKYEKLYPEKFVFDGDEHDDEDMEFQIAQPYVRNEPKVGRNEPCPCGSGKKYKKCCG